RPAIKARKTATVYDNGARRGDWPDRSGGRTNRALSFLLGVSSSCGGRCLARRSRSLPRVSSLPRPGPTGGEAVCSAKHDHTMRLKRAFLILGTMVLWSELAPAQTKAGGEGSGTAAAAAPKASGTQPSAGTAGASGTAPPAGSPGAEAAKAPGAAPPAAPSPAAAPPAAAPGATATAPTAAGTAGAVDGGTYVVRLRDLEMRIDELKEQIRRSHTRLSLLSDTILSGGVGGARAVITFKTELSGAFRLPGAVFVLDGVVQFNRQDASETGLLANQKEIPIFSG